MRNLLLVLLIAMPVGVAHANVGVFTGFGHTVQLSKSEKLQMVSETVTIVPGRGRFLFNGGVAGMDRVEYSCVFVLKNLKKEAVDVQVGFPLNSQFMSYSSAKKTKTSELIANYSFIAQEESKVYNVRYSPADKEKKLKHLFTWDMQFMAEETKTLRVTYAMPISMTLASTAIERKRSSYDKRWYGSLEGCMLEFFGYVTETGKSWAGPIEKATFKVYVKGFEEYLRARPFAEGLKADEKKKMRKRFPVWYPIVYRDLNLDGWTMDQKGFMTLSFENYKADDNLLFSYYLLPFPKTVDDARAFAEKMSGKEYTDEDRQDLLDIYREYNGEKTGNKRIESFVKNQKWHGKKIQTPIPESVLSVFKK